MSLHPQTSVCSSFILRNTFRFVILRDLHKIKHPHVVYMLFLFLRRNEPKKIEYQVLVQGV